MAEEGVSAAELSWLDEFLKYEARELIGASELASKAAIGLSKALGPVASVKDTEDWLSSVPQAVDKAAKEAVRVSEQEPVELTKPAELEIPEPVEITEPIEITDEIYDELAEALATDLVKAVRDGEQQLIEFLLTDDDGLWAQVRKDIVEELQTQDLTELSRDTLSEMLNTYAQEAMDAALEGLREGIAEAGGYLWLLTPSE